MDIYLLLGVPVIGEIGPETISRKVITCEVCERWEILYSDITYAFDRWRGEDIIAGGGKFFISQRLKKQLEDKRIKGYKTSLVNVTFSKQRGSVKKIGKGAYQKELPYFYYFEITGKAKGAIDDWYKIIDPTECKKCKKNKKMFSSKAYESRINPELTGKDIENPLACNVYAKSWNGDDIFILQDDIGLPIMTQNFIDVLIEMGIKINVRESVWIRPTSWIE
jgi:hypothetical protein